MPVNAGTIIISCPSLEDANFEQRVILITENNEKGAMGFVINHLFSRALNELEEFKLGIAFPIYDGGPMDREHLYFIHRRKDIIEDGEQISGTVYLGGNFKKAVAAINQNITGQKDLKILLGYCGWDYGQLEEELEEGSWLITTADTATVFTEQVMTLWEILYKKYSSFR